MVGADTGKTKRDMDTAKVGSWHRAMKGGIGQGLRTNVRFKTGLLS